MLQTSDEPSALDAIESTPARRRRHPFAPLGAIVVLLVAAIVAAAVLTARHRDTEGTTLVVRVPSAYGVWQGDPVWLSGTRVGRVVKIQLLKDGTVELFCWVDPNVRRPPGAQVVVTTGLFGDRRVEIATRRATKPEDNPAVGFIRAEQGLRPNPLDPLVAASSRLMSDAARVRTRAQPRADASLKALARLRESVATLQATSKALAARGVPTIAIPRMRVPSSHSSARLQAQMERTLADAQRARAALAAARGAFSDPEIERDLAEDERAVREALVELRGVMPAR